jgi:hypothetical protein
MKPPNITMQPPIGAPPVVMNWNVILAPLAADHESR